MRIRQLNHKRFVRRGGNDDAFAASGRRNPDPGAAFQETLRIVQAAFHAANQPGTCQKTVFKRRIQVGNRNQALNGAGFPADFRIKQQQVRHPHDGLRRLVPDGMRKLADFFARNRLVRPLFPLSIRKPGEIQRSAKSLRMDGRHPDLPHSPSGQLHTVQRQPAGLRLKRSGGTLHLQTGQDDLAVHDRNHHARFPLDIHSRAPGAERHDPSIHGEQRRNAGKHSQKHKDAGRPADGFQHSAQRRARFRSFRFSHFIYAGRRAGDNIRSPRNTLFHRLKSN